MKTGLQQMVMRILIAAIAGITASSALILANSPSSMVQSRQANFKHLLSLDRSVRAELSGPAPDAAEIERTAIAERQLAMQIPSWFPPKSRTESGTYARQEIWTNPEDFRAKANDLAQVFATLAQDARSRQVDRIRAEEGEIGSRCQACHRSYVVRF